MQEDLLQNVKLASYSVWVKSERCIWNLFHQGDSIFFYFNEWEARVKVENTGT